MSIPFLNRSAELASLERMNSRRTAQLVAVFGRRRIGKTSLLLEWLARHRIRGVYWVAHRSTGAVLLASFSEALAQVVGTTDPNFRFSSWEAALRELARLAQKQAMTVVIDELPYLLGAEPAFGSVLQKVWDHALKRSRIRLILAGSHYHMMHETITSPRGPLFGRATSTLHVDEVGLSDISLFLPAYSVEQLVETASVIGGVPKYLEMWNDRVPVMRNIADVVLGDDTVFRNEPSFLIQDEIADPRTYVAILEAIGTGARRPVAIAKVSGVNPAHVGKYLHTLGVLGLVRRIVSAEQPATRSSRNTQYEIRDPYLRFHFTFVQPSLRLIEQKRKDRVMDMIRQRFDAYVGRTGYEQVCRSHIATLADNSELPFEAREVGRLWDRQVEVDVAAIGARHNAALIGECRWRRKKMNEADLDQLVLKGARLKKLSQYKLHYALFSKAGFSKSLEKRAARERVMLVEGVPETFR